MKGQRLKDWDSRKRQAGVDFYQLCATPYLLLRTGRINENHRTNLSRPGVDHPFLPLFEEGLNHEMPQMPQRQADCNRPF